MTLKPWSIESRRITYEDRWLKVVTDACRAADGKPRGDFHTFEYPDWVNVVALTDAGKVVLVREYRHARRSIALGLPGGAIGSAAETPERAAARELLEETGYAAERWVELGHSAVNAATHSNALWSFLALGARQVAAPSSDEGEELEIELRDFFELAADFGTLEEAQALHLTSVLLALRYLNRERVDVQR
jgi:8-oxo-dGTP pyrophosphatase MutT (NUDIX family)